MAGVEFKPKYGPLADAQSRILVQATMAELGGVSVDMTKPLPFLSEIVKKRVDAMELPIKFTHIAYLAINAFARNPGQAVVLLIDALNKFPEGSEVTVDDLCNLYPFGFYTEESFVDYIDNYIKPHKTKWSQVYATNATV